MKFLTQGIVVVMIAVAAVFAQSTKQSLDNCLAQLNDERMISRKLKEEAKKASDENVSLKRERDAAVRDKEQAVKQAEDLRARNTELDRTNRELAASANSVAANVENLQAIVNEKDRLATENANLRNQLASTSVAVSAPAPETFLYPVSGVLTKKEVQVQNNVSVIVADFVFSNNGSKTITSFDSMLKFYVQGRKIYEIKLPNVRNMSSGAAFSRNETIRFRAGLPITDQNLVNAPVEAIDLVVEVTKIQ